jgi:predicted metal-dependent hydrolase
MAHTRWQPGGELPYLGKRIVIGVGGDSRQASLSGDADAPQDGDTLWLALPSSADQGRIRDSAQAWLQQRAGAWFGARLAHFLQVSGLKIQRWRLSSAATRWGSCTSDGNIMLNWRLIHFAPAIIDYVIAHELAHLREMNHSQDFWREVGQILPDFEDAKNILRRHDPASLPQF